MATPVPAEAHHINASPGDATVNLGAGSAVGDLVVVVGVLGYYALANMGTPTGPWTGPAEVIDTADLGSNDVHMRAWFAYVTTPGIQPVTMPNFGDVAVFVHVFRFAAADVPASNPIDAHAADTFPNPNTLPDVTTDAQAPSCSPLSVDGLLISCVMSGGGANRTYTTPPDMDLSGTESNFGTLAIATQALTGSGPTGTRLWQSLSTARHAMMSIVVRGAASAPPAEDDGTIWLLVATGPDDWVQIGGA